MSNEEAIILVGRFKNELSELIEATTMSQSVVQSLQQYIDAYDMAIFVMRYLMEREENASLTLEELRKMDGEPVWIVSLTDDFTSWGIVRVTEMGESWSLAVAGTSRIIGFKDDYGETWTAYRSKQERTQQ